MVCRARTTRLLTKRSLHAPLIAPTKQPMHVNVEGNVCIVVCHSVTL